MVDQQKQSNNTQLLIPGAPSMAGLVKSGRGPFQDLTIELIQFQKQFALQKELNLKNQLELGKNGLSNPVVNSISFAEEMVKFTIAHLQVVNLGKGGNSLYINADGSLAYIGMVDRDFLVEQSFEDYLNLPTSVCFRISFKLPKPYLLYPPSTKFQIINANGSVWDSLWVDGLPSKLNIRRDTAFDGKAGSFAMVLPWVEGDL